MFLLHPCIKYTVCHWEWNHNNSGYIYIYLIVARDNLVVAGYRNISRASLLNSTPLKIITSDFGNYSSLLKYEEVKQQINELIQISQKAYERIYNMT